METREPGLCGPKASRPGVALIEPERPLAGAVVDKLHRRGEGTAHG